MSGVGRVKDASRREDGWGDGDERNSSGEVSGMGNGDGMVEVKRDTNENTFSTNLT